MGHDGGMNGMDGRSGLEEMDGMDDYNYPQAGPSTAPPHRSAEHDFHMSYPEGSGGTPILLPKKRGRPPKNRTPDPYSQSFASPIPSGSKPRSRASGAGARPRPSHALGKSRLGQNGDRRTPLAGQSSDSIHAHITIVDETCSFCEHGVETNRDGEPESMLCCTHCGRSGHFSCLEFKTEEIRRKVLEYDWQCMDCKYCEKCEVLGREVSLVPTRTLGPS